MHPAESPSTSTSLVNQAREGGQSAWYRLVETYTPVIKHWCGRYGVRGADAEDVVQNVFVTVSKHIANFRMDGSDHSFRGWLWTIANSRIIDLLRANKRLGIVRDGQKFEEFFLPDERSDTSHMESRDSLKLRIARALPVIQQDFSEQTWTAFWQTTLLGRRPSEVANEMGMSAAAVCMCRARVLKRLRETIGDFNTYR